MHKNNRTLSQYTNQWSVDYSQKLRRCQLFQPDFAKNLTLSQKQNFIKYFYHIRGNFYTFLWFIGSLAPNVEYRKVALANITEEFGISMSHEQWYIEFAAAHNVDLRAEIIEKKYNAEFIKTYNKGHIDYILNHNFDLVWSVFSAYEKLDNFDYPSLQTFATNIGTNGKALTFFRIHSSGNRYDSTSNLLQESWERDPKIVIQAFKFVANHQLMLWNDLYDTLKF
jgi:DNA-dependent RNA polymerase auxiliary subunit epsilon